MPMCLVISGARRGTQSGPAGGGGGEPGYPQLQAQVTGAPLFQGQQLMMYFSVGSLTSPVRLNATDALSVASGTRGPLPCGA